MNNQQELRMRLDMLIPMSFFISHLGWDREQTKIGISRVVELNTEWSTEVANNLEHKVSDVLHDFMGIYSEDEHFLPRIQAEEFNCEMCSKSMDEEEHDFSDICDDCREQDDSEDILGDFDENGDAVDLKLKSIMMEKFDVKYQSDANGWGVEFIDAVDVKTMVQPSHTPSINGYTNIETYRLCLVLDNTEYWKEDILQTFFRLVREDEFSPNDINIIDWNEVIKRYSDDLIETNIHHHNE